MRVPVVQNSAGQPIEATAVAPAGFAYETVAASQTAQILGPIGAVGDYLSHILIQPATTSPGNVIVLDGATTVFTFTGGATSVTSLTPITVPFLTNSASGAWKITTGTNVAVVGVGSFT
ncbi:MAG: hypothetical protein ABW043_16670 [Devosia sp.]|uniref:hypothetical protein n=1 Tax=Devosia sp. TaxID=1871048 RepID=UPI0033948838